MARPTKLTKDVQDKVINAIKLGNYIETAASYAGINKTTLYDWMKRGAREQEKREKGQKPNSSETKYVRFSNAIEKAMAESEVRDVGLIGAAAKENWQAAAWRLERKFPDRWGRKTHSLDREVAIATIKHKQKQAELTALKAALLRGDGSDTTLMEKILQVVSEHDEE